MKISSQLTLSLLLIFAVQSKAHGAKNSLNSGTLYKVEKCDCVGYSEGIPTFLSDITGSSGAVFGEGESLTKAHEQARNMCIESYRGLTSITTPDASSISESGCQMFKTTQEGDWEAI